jgi:hypothetical protein
MQSDRKTQIYLSDEEYRGLKRRAGVEGRSMASVVREAVATYLTSARAGSRGTDPLLGLGGVADGRRDDSASIDDVLYGSSR